MTASHTLRCSICGARYDSAELEYCCPADDGVLDVEIDQARVTQSGSPESIGRDPDRSLWRNACLLPVARPERAAGPLGNVGGTPLYAATRAAERLGLERLWIKDEGRLPTGSLKDRASAVVVARALERGAPRIVTASTGNAGVALAAMTADAGLRAVVMVPESAPLAKIAQLLVFDAELVLVRGNYDAAFALSRKAAERFGWYCRNTGYNPYTAEGKKTVAFEICDTFGGPSSPATPWRAPDRVYVSVGDGNIISGVHKGLKELLSLGWIDKMPRLVGVQAEGSAAVARAFAAGGETIEPVAASTIADSISADSPADGLRALRAARHSGGSFVTVSDEQILDALAALGRDAAVFAEPAAAAAYAGLLAELRTGAVDRAEQIVVLVTGNGLKDVPAATRAVSPPAPIEPNLDALGEALGER